MFERRHSMPFGAEPQPGGGVRFQLWAPGARHVELLLETDSGPPQPIAMRRGDGGWYRTESDAARPGSLYRYRIDHRVLVPDPASRFNPCDVHGPSMVVNPGDFDWPDTGWQGRPWHEVVLYELHVGAFTDSGDFAGVERRLDHLLRLGVTAVELMPVADFPGRRNWGYDGALWFAPDSSYGTPAALKRLVAAAHARGLMVLLDVVYNHFGPEGNYLHLYAPQFFDRGRHTPWGAAIAYDGPERRAVRDFVIHNALYWLEEYHFDGLRFDAVHAIGDGSTPDILTELAAAVRSGPGRHRHVHLVLENDANQAAYLRDESGSRYDAQWNDDAHHCLHVIATGESDGYYADYVRDPRDMLRRCLAEGFAYQGEPSTYRGGIRRGESSRGLRPTAFVSFLQNHDQVGNRLRSERLHSLVTDDAVLTALTALLLLAPAPPLLFMGEEWHADQPFPFFCDLEPTLAAAVRDGRKREFRRFHQFADPARAAAMPDPGAVETFESARLCWSTAAEPRHREWLRLYRRLLRLRHREIVPRLPGAEPGRPNPDAGKLLGVDWRLGDGSVLRLLANLSAAPAALPRRPAGRRLYSTQGRIARGRHTMLDAWTTLWLLERPRAPRAERAPSLARRRLQGCTR